MLSMQGREQSVQFESQMDVDVGSTSTQDLSLQMDTQQTVEDGASRKRNAEDEAEEESDAEADYDGEEMMPPYVLDDRPLPNLPIYHPDIKVVQANSMEMVQHFQERIRGFTYKDAETLYLLDLFDRLEHPPHETNITKIALHGDAGHGKSSFLNAILGVDISDWGDDGNSCTFVVQEFAQASPTQTHSFKAEIQFFSRNACIDMVKNLFQQCYSYLNADDAEDEEGLEALQMQYNTALVVFSALFKGKREFRNREAAEEFLSDAKSANDQAILGRLVGWTEDILLQLTQNRAHHASATDATSFNADTVQGLKKAVRPFTTTVEFPNVEGTNMECCPWPLVKKVCTTFKSKLLEQNITIADCPGTSDKNGLRVDQTKNYLADCDITIVVSKIDRAIDNLALYHNISEAYRRKRSGSVIVVCTRSDDVNMNGEQRFSSTIWEERVLAKIAEDEIHVLERLERARTAYNFLPPNTGMVKRFFMRARKEKYERQKRQIDSRRFEARVMARNRHVKDSIQQAYKEDTKDPVPLPIFCVSNTMFMTYMSGYEKKDCPPLTLEGTQILAARDHIIGIPSTGKFNSLWHHCDTALELAIDTVEISCSTTKLKRKEDLNRTFERARGNLREIVEDIAERFVEQEFGVVLGVISGNESKRINRAGYRCDKWSKLNAGSHRAIMRKGGAHGTAKVPWQDWNEEIYEILREDLDPALEAFYTADCEDLSTNISERIGDTIDSLDRTLDRDPAAALSGAVKAFKRNLKHRRKQIDTLCESFKETLRKDVRTIQMRASTHAPDHYLSEALSKIYQYALDQPKGKGLTLHKTRCTAFKGRLCAYGGIFKEVHDGVKSEFEAFFKFNIDTLVDEMDGIFDEIQHDVNRVCSTNEDDSEEGKAIREELLAMLPAEREFLLEKIQKPLKACK
ncbi:hypothetical protein DM02DRAFT_704523 [Periconia macrospinosa]|uniref:P-loop containing nucleoside triphosphate hydrolase protein n=1 Tax=Periconia macrospinosa TaxID=97972 RepID=A0A2V1DUQ3_9PLEO|nr:hypothetical protein DM02DRAFT_704523 [Periconia macrospinosa]